ncbi:MAG: hypothetical protein Q9223_001130 [Gallowayella weberi]
MNSERTSGRISLPPKTGDSAAKYKCLGPDQSFTKHVLRQPTTRTMSDQNRQTTFFSLQNLIPRAAHVLSQGRQTSAPGHAPETGVPTFAVAAETYGVAGAAIFLEKSHPFDPDESAAETAMDKDYWRMG